MQTPGNVEQAQRLFRAVLAPWASDLLDLRRRGLDTPSFRRGNRLILQPGGWQLSSRGMSVGAFAPTVRAAQGAQQAA